MHQGTVCENVSKESFITQIFNLKLHCFYTKLNPCKNILLNHEGAPIQSVCATVNLISIQQ